MSEKADDQNSWGNTKYDITFFFFTLHFVTFKAQENFTIKQAIQTPFFQLFEMYFVVEYHHYIVQHLTRTS